MKKAHDVMFMCPALLCSYIRQLPLAPRIRAEYLAGIVLLFQRHAVTRLNEGAYIRHMLYLGRLVRSKNPVSAQTWTLFTDFIRLYLPALQKNG